MQVSQATIIYACSTQHIKKTFNKRDDYDNKMLPKVISIQVNHEAVQTRTTTGPVAVVTLVNEEFQAHPGLFLVGVSLVMVSGGISIT